MLETVDEFYRIRLENDESGVKLAHEVLRLISPPPGLPSTNTRLVVFQSLVPTPEAMTFASDGAYTMLAAIGVPVFLDAMPVYWPELPDGLALIVGDASDRDRYERRMEEAGGPWFAKRVEIDGVPWRAEWRVTGGTPDARAVEIFFRARQRSSRHLHATLVSLEDPADLSASRLRGLFDSAMPV